MFAYEITPPKPPTYYLKNGDQETEIMVYPQMVRAVEDHVGFLGYVSHIYRHPYKDIFVEAFNLRDYLFYFDFEKESYYAVHQKGALSFDDYYDDSAFSEGEESVKFFYIACGISGQIQHIAGMRESSLIMSINQDPDAPINAIADYVVTGRVEDVIPKLIRNLKEISK